MKVVGFGDFLIHFSPVMDERFMQSRLVQMSYTGAEANVCAALGLWGEKTEFVTRLPGHVLAQSGISFLKSLSVGTEHIVTGEGRMGTYYLEKGSGVRPSVVIYDRVPSAFTESSYEDYDWESILQGADILYLTGITPALSDSLLECVERVCKKAAERGMRIFYDVNHRPKLQNETKASAIFAKLQPYITDLIGNEEHLKMILQIESAFGEENYRERLLDAAKQTMEKTGIANVAVTMRRTPSASRAIFCAAYMRGMEAAVSPKYDLQVVDRVGSGDAFSAGLVYSAIRGRTAEDAVCFAAAACAMKHEIISDINYSTVAEIEALKNQQGYDVRR